MCNANRFYEAHELSLRYPDLEIGREREPLQHVIKKRQPFVEERNAGVEIFDYQQILKNFFT